MTRWIILIVTVIVLTAAATFFTQNVSNSEAGPTPVAVNESKGPQPKVEIVGPLRLRLRHDVAVTNGLAHLGSQECRRRRPRDVDACSRRCSCTIAKLAADPAMGKEKAEGAREAEPDDSDRARVGNQDVPA